MNSRAVTRKTIAAHRLRLLLPSGPAEGRSGITRTRGTRPAGFSLARPLVSRPWRCRERRPAPSGDDPIRSCTAWLPAPTMSLMETEDQSTGTAARVARDRVDEPTVADEGNAQKDQQHRPCGSRSADDAAEATQQATWSRAGPVLRAIWSSPSPSPPDVIVPRPRVGLVSAVSAEARIAAQPQSRPTERSPPRPGSA